MSRTLFRAVAGLVLALVLPAAGASAQADRVEALLRREMQLRRIPGLQVAVVQHGRVVLARSFGTADLTFQVPATNQTLFPINSITKAFTGVALLQLVERGKLDLDAPVSAYIDELPEAWRTVPIRQLVTHMSGLPNIYARGGKLPDADDVEAAAWARVKSLPIAFAPGERYDYNQTNSALLGKVIDKLAGTGFAQFITEQQLRVVPMQRTGWSDAADVVPNRATSYRYVYGGLGDPGSLRALPETFAPFLRSGSGLYSTAEELARWIIAVQQGKLLRPSSLPVLWTPGRFNDGKLGEWSIGWLTVERPQHRAVGATGGGRSAFYLYPQDDTAVVILTNLAGAAPEDLLDQVAALYIPGMRLPDVTALRIELQKRGFEYARDVADELARKHADFSLSELALNNWAYRLLVTGQQKQALEIFKLAAALYPASGNAYDSLAEAYAANGDKQHAIENYKRSLALDPKNKNAERWLQKLGA
jgi:CubicO group peptidase (beta-lactamase class C family)